MAAAISAQELEGGLYQGPSCVLAVMAEIVVALDPSIYSLYLTPVWLYSSQNGVKLRY